MPTKPKTAAQLKRERDRALGRRLDASLASTYETRRADPYNIASWDTKPRKPSHATKRSPSQLDREIASSMTLKSPRIKKMGYVTGLPVYLVSGEKVRNDIDIDFTQGGNEAAYPSYVPAKEIWIDDAMHSLDRIATIFHEIVERNLVMYGGMSYDKAHDIACKREIEFRKELARKKPTTTDLKLVTAALKPYSSEAIDRGKKPGKPSRIPGKQ
jgi:hypothetical protein